jgi:hypothetical protein
VISVEPQSFKWCCVLTISSQQSLEGSGEGQEKNMAKKRGESRKKEKVLELKFRALKAFTRQRVEHSTKLSSSC